MANGSPNIRRTHATAAEMTIWAFHVTDSRGQALDLPWAIAQGASEPAAKLAACCAIPPGSVLGKGEQISGPTAKNLGAILADSGSIAQLFGTDDLKGYPIVSSGS
jgi:hypothetical protein